MRCEDVRERLDGWVEEALGAEERARLAAHLETCEACRAEARAFEALLAAAADLPREIRPPRDLWAGIDARLDAPTVATVPVAARRRPASGLPRWALVAAALALVVVTAALSSILTRQWDEAMALKIRRSGGPTGPAGAPPGAETAGGDQEARFLAASQELLAGLEDQDLSPETMAIVRRNLEVIDAAIVELHAALERDPGNGELNRMLLATYQRKIDLLEQAARSGEG
ncbi:MAG: zf-HC2 domain-containing protein [Gemmatimonadota bacterium]